MSGTKKGTLVQKRKRRGRPSNSNQSDIDKNLKNPLGQNKRMANKSKGGRAKSRQLSTIVAPTTQQRNNNLQSKSLSKKDLNENSSTDDELIDLSEKANRIEGAGGNEFHYFCRICKYFQHIPCETNNFKYYFLYSISKVYIFFQ